MSWETRLPPSLNPCSLVPLPRVTSAMSFFSLPEITCLHGAGLMGSGSPRPSSLPFFFSVSPGGEEGPPVRSCPAPISCLHRICLYAGFYIQAPRVAKGKLLEVETRYGKGCAFLDFESNCQIVFLRSCTRFSSCQQCGRVSAGKGMCHLLRIVPGWQVEATFSDC